MSDDLRTRIAAALADHEQSDLGLDADRYPIERWLCCADAALADVLARAAALPPLDTDGMTLDEKVAATIRQVVAASPLRLEFPPVCDPAEAP